jgi:serine/threonine protein kinase
MDPDRWRRIKDVYSEACKRQGGERERFLADACAGDPLLRDEVEGLLSQPASTNNLLELFGGPELALVASLGVESDPSALIGQRIGIYDVQSLLGAGAMGDVYRARDTKLGRDVALKMLPALLTADPDRRMRLEREARVLASLNHPNIAAIYELEESRGPALVLELVEGETLKDRLARGHVPIMTALHVARQIADALAAAHWRGIVHRDLKPSNIKITPDGVVKVLDFGIAKVVSDDAPRSDFVQPATTASSATRAGAIVGTAGYMSPEQARGDPVDKRADIWAFGCVLYEMLSGRGAFAGDTVADTIAAIAAREPDWTALPGNVPSTVRRLLQQCLEKDPSQRLGRIDEARATLERLVAAGTSWRMGYRAVAAIAVALSVLAGAAVIFYGRPVERARSDSQGAPVRADQQRGQPWRGREGVLLLPQRTRDQRLSVRERLLDVPP